METESTRQQKVAKQIQKDLSEMFIKEVAGVVRGAMVTITTVRVTPDLSSARVYLSVFPFDKSEQIMKAMEKNNWMIRKTLGERIRHQFRIVPELTFFLDDSLNYLEKIDKLIDNK